jgi:hypothetical protein
MRIETGHDRSLARAAHSALGAPPPVDSTLLEADVAGLQAPVGLLDPLL